MKPAVPVETIAGFLTRTLGSPPDRLERLSAEGMESQAFTFESDARTYVLRINPSLRGFEKNRWAAEMVGARVPVPRVTALGMLDEDYAYCITEWAPGVTLEDLPVEDVGKLVNEVQAAWTGFASCDVSGIAGFGDFDARGNASASSWRDVLLGTLDGEGASDEPVLAVYRELVDRCPEERALVHGDFGANNVLVHEGRVNAVLDWDCAMVGDPLYDVANMRFWATHLPCMEVQAAHFDRTLSMLPGYRERVLCYAVRIGIEEAHEARRGGDSEVAKWALARCRELVAAYEPGLVSSA